MPQGRQKSPGSFRDELGGVIERLAPEDQKHSPKPEKTETPVKSSGEQNDRLFWRRPDERS
jgi:hypothetical protein